MAINLNNLIYPYFIVPGSGICDEIEHFPGIKRFSIDLLLEDIGQADALGLRKVLLFGTCVEKDSAGSGAYKKENPVARAIKEIKNSFKKIDVMADVCLCAYTSHGHCGILKKNGKGIDLRNTLKALSEISLLYAQAGADWVAPSAMASGQVLAIRKLLNSYGYRKVKIMGYSAKFNSNFYGPFRNAAGSTPKFGDRSAYQLDYRDSEKGLKKIKEDIDSGADMVMVKPALGYLDIVARAKQEFNFPLAVYNVSGEYALVKYGVLQGFLDEKKIVAEVISSIKRSGADCIITYHAKDIARWVKKENYLI